MVPQYHGRIVVLLGTVHKFVFCQSRVLQPYLQDSVLCSLLLILLMKDVPACTF